MKGPWRQRVTELTIKTGSGPVHGLEVEFGVDFIARAIDEYYLDCAHEVFIRPFMTASLPLCASEKCTTENGDTMQTKSSVWCFVQNVQLIQCKLSIYVSAELLMLKYVKNGYCAVMNTFYSVEVLCVTVAC